MSDIDFVHIEKELIIVENQNVGAIVLKNDGNVLTNIRIDESERNKGYGFNAVQSWLEECQSQGFNNAYVANVNHPAMKKIMDKISNYETKKIDPREVPADIKPGPHINDTCYKINL
jgi:predicted acetyltransferase